MFKLAHNVYEYKLLSLYYKTSQEHFLKYMYSQIYLFLLFLVYMLYYNGISLFLFIITIDFITEFFFSGKLKKVVEEKFKEGKIEKPYDIYLMEINFLKEKNINIDRKPESEILKEKFIHFKSYFIFSYLVFEYFIYFNYISQAVK